MKQREAALSIFRAAVQAVHPSQLLHHYLHSDAENIRIGSQLFSRNSVDRLVVIAVGKAAAAMSQEAERLLGNAITYGICVTKHGHGLPLQNIILHEAGHPTPDADSVAAAKAVIQMIDGSSATDIILVLLSGGASSLLADIPKEISLDDYKILNDLLINSGANILEINTIRKSISTLKGGKFLEIAAPARVITLAISDVLNDDISMIGSGPTVGAVQPAIENVTGILKNHNIYRSLPTGIFHYFESQAGHLTKAENRQGTSPSSYYLIANNNKAVDAAVAKSTALGFHTVVFKRSLSGDAEREARMLVRQLKDFRGALPACFILGGETTVHVNANGKGGRCQHFVLCAIDELMRSGAADQLYSTTILAAGTDGTDGPTDAAGAICDYSVIKHAQEKRLSTADYIERYDSYPFFSRTGGLIKTKPTQTNVSDIILYIISA